jgi:acetyl-CoA C-acetyltransferase
LQFQVDLSPPDTKWCSRKGLDSSARWYRVRELRGHFAQLASAYRAKHNVPKADLKPAMAQVSWKSHQNGVLNSKAHLRKEVSLERILN